MLIETTTLNSLDPLAIIAAAIAAWIVGGIWYGVLGHHWLAALAGRKPLLVVIDAGHWLAAMLAAGLVIGLLG